VSALKRVLFVCVGNACRSQMAEGFARKYGSDVLIAASAGLAPASGVASDTVRAMDEKSINLRDHFPKHLRHLERVKFDLVINISGYPLPESIECEVRGWDIDDPVCMDYAEHCEIRDQIERKVMELILEFRRAQAAPNLTRFGSAPGS